MSNFTKLSLETHLFFARIMKEHGLFLEAGFPCVESTWIEKADRFKEKFEDLLRDTVQLANGRVGKEILRSGEVVTEFTLSAEQHTEKLSGVAIDSRITERQQSLKAGNFDSWESVEAINILNQRSLELLKDFICFKEKILEEVKKGQLFNANYPLLIEHILREAKLYRATIKELQENWNLSYQCMRETEKFWNQIMMEHALFIRGLLDPSETELVKTAHNFAMEYKELLEKARVQDCRAMGLTEEILEETLKYRDFKAAGTEGILECKIASVILPLLADHVLREANHYIRLLEMTDM